MQDGGAHDSKQDKEILKRFCTKHLVEHLPDAMPRIHPVPSNFVLRLQLQCTSFNGMPIDVQTAPGYIPGTCTDYKREFQANRTPYDKGSGLSFAKGSSSTTGTDSKWSSLFMFVRHRVNYQRFGLRVSCDTTKVPFTSDLMVCKAVLPFEVDIARLCENPHIKNVGKLFPGKFIRMRYVDRSNKNKVSVIVYPRCIIICGCKQPDVVHAVGSLAVVFLQQYARDAE